MYKKQSGGSGKFADIVVDYFSLMMMRKTLVLVFVNSVKGGNVPREFIPSVEKGFKDGYGEWSSSRAFPVDSLKVVLERWWSFHRSRFRCTYLLSFAAKTGL